ncbi:hypothetical protein HPP92_003826 [Vanilla planifolia]|uniref:Probable purine permease n=1 Tax=Vanilla planifolia TaxID=51239 RepID=A0A835VKA9_VANPL|nr:hypothetical protein HPP92_003826 [Vanilla planifolia]
MAGEVPIENYSDDFSDQGINRGRGDGDRHPRSGAKEGTTVVWNITSSSADAGGESPQRRLFIAINCLILCVDNMVIALLESISSTEATGDVDPSAVAVHARHPPLPTRLRAISLLTGLDDFLYALRTGLPPRLDLRRPHRDTWPFTALFAYFIIKQRFTAFSINAVALLTVGRRCSPCAPATAQRGETRQVLEGFVLTLQGCRAVRAGVAVGGAYLHAKAGRAILTVVMGCGLSSDSSYRPLPSAWSSTTIQKIFMYIIVKLKAVGVISCVNTLLAGVLIAVFIPVVEFLAAIFLEKFTGERVALLCLWGLASYSHGEYREGKEAAEQVGVTV